MLEQSTAACENDLLLDKARPEACRSNVRPWQQGYSLAKEWAESTALHASDNSVDIEGHLTNQKVRIKNFCLAETSIGAVSIAHANRASLVAINQNHPRNKFPTGRRFTLAHELCHLLYDRERGIGLQIASGPWAPVEVEQRANAFAAQLLMPDELIIRTKDYIGQPYEKMIFSKIADAAQQLQVSIDALVHHLYNRDVISLGKMEELIAQLQNRN